MVNFIKKHVCNLHLYIIYIMIALIPITFIFNQVSFYLRFHIFLKYYKLYYFLLPLEFLIYVYGLYKRKWKLDIFDYLIIILGVLGFISTVYAIDINMAIFGRKSRDEGLIQILTYYLIFLNSRNIVDKSKIINIINLLIIVGLLQTCYSILQVFVRGRYIYVFREVVNYRASGFIGHPNILGSYIVLTLLLSIGMYLLYNENKIMYLFSSIMLYVNLILTESTGPFYSFIFGLFFLFIFLLKKKCISWKKIVGITVTCVALLFIVSGANEYVTRNVFLEEFKDGFSIKSDINDNFNLLKRIAFAKKSNNGDKVDEKTLIAEIDEQGCYRLWIWRRSLKLVPKYWLHGTGIDNFGSAFKTVDDRNVAFFDKAHNEYLQILITEGLPTLLVYLLLLFLVFKTGVKSKNSLTWILLFSFVGYSVQIFMNISMYLVAPLYYLIMGLLLGCETIKSD